MPGKSNDGFLFLPDENLRPALDAGFGAIPAEDAQSLWREAGEAIHAAQRGAPTPLAVAEELHSAMDDVLNDFADIENTEEFASIRNDPYQFATVEELRTACFAARGMVAQPKQKAAGVCRQPIVNNYSNENSNSRYGDLFDRFGRKDN